MRAVVDNVTRRHTVTVSIVPALTLSHLDYCNAVFASQHWCHGMSQTIGLSHCYKK